MVQNSQEYRLKYWVTCSSIRSFACTAHTFTSPQFLAHGKVNDFFVNVFFHFGPQWDGLMVRYGFLGRLTFSMCMVSSVHAHVRVRAHVRVFFRMCVLFRVHVWGLRDVVACKRPSTSCSLPPHCQTPFHYGTA